MINGYAGGVIHRGAIFTVTETTEWIQHAGFTGPGEKGFKTCFYKTQHRAIKPLGHPQPGTHIRLYLIPVMM